MRKIKAFTLMELLIGMIISALVVVFCFMSYFIIYRQYLNYKSTKQTITDVMQMNTVITSDFTNAKTISTIDDNNFILCNENGQVLEYRFATGYITRKQGEVMDTFKISINNWQPGYLSEKDSSKINLVHNFSFDALVLGDSEHFSFTKKYAADVIMNNKNNFISNQVKDSISY